MNKPPLCFPLLLFWLCPLQRGCSVPAACSEEVTEYVFTSRFPKPEWINK